MIINVNFKLNKKNLANFYCYKVLQRRPDKTFYFQTKRVLKVSNFDFKN